VIAPFEKLARDRRRRCGSRAESESSQTRDDQRTGDCVRRPHALVCRELHVSRTSIEAASAATWSGRVARRAQATAMRDRSRENGEDRPRRNRERRLRRDEQQEHVPDEPEVKRVAERVARCFRRARAAPEVFRRVTRSAKPRRPPIAGTNCAVIVTVDHQIAMIAHERTMPAIDTIG